MRFSGGWSLALGICLVSAPLRSQSLTEYPIPFPGTPGAIVATPDGSVWIEVGYAQRYRADQSVWSFRNISNCGQRGPLSDRPRARRQRLVRRLAGSDRPDRTGRGN